MCAGTESCPFRLMFSMYLSSEFLEPPNTLKITVFVVGVLEPIRSLLKTLEVVIVVALTVSVKVSSWAMRVLVVGVVVVEVVVVEVVVVEVVVLGVFGKRTTVAVAEAQGVSPLSGQSL